MRWRRGFGISRYAVAGGIVDKIKMLPKLAELGSFFPKTVKTGDCKDVRRHGKDVNLFDFRF